MLPGARSIISLAMSYLSEDIPDKPKSPAGRVAKYAMGKDYHGVMEKRLKTFVKGLSEHIGSDIKAKVYVDTGPMLDRAVAERSGIGWFGKNTNILTDKGSWVVLAQIITNLKLEESSISKKNCACGGLLIKTEYPRGSKSAAGENFLKWGSVEQDFASKYRVSKGFSTAKAAQNPQKFPASGRNI